MTRDEFTRYAARFGDDVDAWPAPYRQEARHRDAEGVGPVADDDAALDRLVFDAVLMPADDTALTRKVMNRISSPARSAGFRSPWQGWLSPLAMAASLAAILMTASAVGYSAAGDRDGGLESALLTLATGEALIGLDLLDLNGGPDTEETL